MSDVRALLRAKRTENETRVNHPYAAYNAAGQLRCSACALNVKNAIAWNGHIGSKGHRTIIAKIKAREEADAAKKAGKRSADGESGDSVSKKRKVSPDDGDDETSGDQQKTPSSGFPNDFFSDPSRAPPPVESDEEEDAPAAPAPAAPAPVDEEWEAFKREVLDPINQDAEIEKEEVFARATVFAEPELQEEIPEGFPTARPADGEEEPEGPPELSERDLREKKELEERELIMDRLLDEERAQEEADNRVETLKSKLEAIRRRKEAAKLQKERGKGKDKS